MDFQAEEKNNGGSRRQEVKLCHATETEKDSSGQSAPGRDIPAPQVPSPRNTCTTWRPGKKNLPAGSSKNRRPRGERTDRPVWESCPRAPDRRRSCNAGARQILPREEGSRSWPGPSQKKAGPS